MVHICVPFLFGYRIPFIIYHQSVVAVVIFSDSAYITHTHMLRTKSDRGNQEAQRSAGSTVTQLLLLLLLVGFLRPTFKVVLLFRAIFPHLNASDVSFRFTPSFFILTLLFVGIHRRLLVPSSSNS